MAKTGSRRGKNKMSARLPGHMIAASRATFCIAAAPNARAAQHESKVTGSLTGMASMDHSPSPINLLFSVLIKAILDAVP
jgi:hypothetical protein